MLRTCLELISDNQKLCENMRAFRFEASLLVKLSAANMPTAPCHPERAKQVGRSEEENQDGNGEPLLQKGDGPIETCDQAHEPTQIESLDAGRCGEWEEEELCESAISKLGSSAASTASMEGKWRWKCLIMRRSENSCKGGRFICMSP